jgi:hypothetical protein
LGAALRLEGGARVGGAGPPGLDDGESLTALASPATKATLDGSSPGGHAST